MTPALLQLLWLSLRGRVRRFGRQLRQPRYLVGFVIGTGWILLWVSSWTRDDTFRRVFFSGVYDEFAGDIGTAIQFQFALFFAIFVSVDWLLPWTRFNLPLKESELHLLLPAPITRKQLVYFALLKAQVPILFTSVLLSFVLGGGNPGGQLRLLLALWLFFTVWDLHQRWRGMTLLRLRQMPSRTARALRWTIVGVAAAYLVVLLERVRILARQVYVDLSGMELKDLDGLRTALERISAATDDPTLSTLLAPFLWIVKPAFADTLGEYAVALIVPAALVLVLQALVVRSAARFEEAALAHARRQAARSSPVRRYTRMSARARRRGPFALASSGRPGLAILWKNLIQIGRLPLLRGLGLVVGAAVAVALILGAVDAPGFGFGILAGVGGWLILFAPLICGLGFRNDFRMELRYVEVVRPWPVPAWQFVTSEALAPALLGTLLSLSGMVLVLAAAYGARFGAWLHGGVSNIRIVNEAGGLGLPADVLLPLILACVLPLAAGVALLVSSLHNLATLMFPAWVGLGPRAGRGMAATGQNLLLAMALGLALLLGLIPGAALVAVAMLIQWKLRIVWGFVDLPFWAVLAATPLFVESAFILRAGAGLWERLDPSKEILESG